MSRVTGTLTVLRLLRIKIRKTTCTCGFLMSTPLLEFGVMGGSITLSAPSSKLPLIRLVALGYNYLAKESRLTQLSCLGGLLGRAPH